MPLDFQPLPLAEAWTRFRATPFLTLGVESRADWVANGVLYVPLGLLGARALAGWGRLAGGGVALALAVLLAFAVEFTQLFFPPRTVSQNDLIAETIGATVGVLAAGALTPWLARWRAAWSRDAALILTLALCAYALLYLLYALFPYDVLLSRAELADKLYSPMWNVLLARPEGFSWLRAALLWGVELVLAVPLGVLLACWVPARRAVPVALAAGAVLGVALELAQLLIASGVTQGVSVVSRALGVAAGAWALNAWRPDSPARLRALLQRHASWWVPLWGLTLLAAAGWGRHDWGGFDRVLQSWADLRFLPFYYHYWTTEAVALTSLASTVVMYAPLAVLAWATRTPARGMAWVAGALAVVVEAGKLPWLVIRPDPTNVLIAVASVALLTAALRRLERGWGRPAGSPPRAAEAVPVAATQPAAAAAGASGAAATVRAAAPVGAVARSLSAAALAVALAAAWQWPVAAPVLVAGLLAVFAAVAWRPALLLVLVPAAWPVLDLGAWTGRVFVDEFDLFMAAVLAGVVWRCGLPRWRAGGWPWSVVAFGASVVLSALWALRAWEGPDPNQFAHLHSPFNGLRIAKGAVWALAFTLAVRRLELQPTALTTALARGVALGLAMTVAWVLWERAAMVGLLDFDAEYRVTGPFSIMNKGGAYIECYLAVAAALVLAWGRRWGPQAPDDGTAGRWALPGGVVTMGLLLAGTAYAVMVTYSRNGYAALAAGGVAVLALAVLQSRGARGRATVLALGVVALIGVVAAPVLAGAFARDRLAATAEDFQVRWNHWAAALSLRDEGVATAVLGMGTGTFPVTHYWRSRDERRAASWRLEPGDGNAFVRLGPGATVYFEQIVDVDAARALTLTMNVHSAAGAPRLALSWCRKTTLTSSDCEGAEVKGIEAPGLWQTQDAELAPLPPPRNLAAAAVPLKLALHTPADGPAVDVDNVSLFVKDATGAERGVNLLRNGGFSQGLDHWHWSTNADPPWHIHSLPVGVLFDQGWLGVLALVLLLTTALLRGLRRVLDGRPLALAGLAGIVAFLVSGGLNTLIDEPRFLMLFLLLAGLAAGPRAAGTSR